VSIGLEDLLDDRSISVEQKGWIIAERLSSEACFRSFPHLAAFRSAQRAEELDEGLARMYDYADRHRIWIT
jgi:hypothetical protein